MSRIRVKKMFVIFLSLTVPLIVIGAFLVGGLAGKLEVSPLVKPINASENFLRNALNSARGHESNEHFFETALLELKMTELPAMPSNPGDNVAFTPVDDGYIVATRGGELHYVELHWPSSVLQQKMPLTIPTEKERFLLEPITEKHSSIPIQYGVKGLLAEQHGDRLSLYASYHYWKADEGCAVMRFARADINLDQLLTSKDSDWQVLFETSPCLNLDSRLNHNGGDATFLQAGGQIISYDDHRLLVTIGDHFMDGIHNTDLVQSTDAAYGKTWLIDKRTGESEMYSMGHRNAQGLTKDQYGYVWATEHGPRGGDQLNRLRWGENYGWPLASYGTLYGGYEYPDGKNWLSHSEFQPAKYTWPQAIAPSNLIRLDNSRFERWGDALILAGLGSRSLFRVQLDGKSVISVEAISVGDRLRDLVQTRSGNILVMSDTGIFYKFEPADASAGTGDAAQALAARGRALWMSCAACHHATSDEGHHIGPNLDGVVNRTIADFDDFEYSSGMSALEGTWTEDRLHEFLAAPELMVPGTYMVAGAVEDESDRQALIEHLKHLGTN